MQKIISMIGMILTMMLFFSGCNSSSSSDEMTKNEIQDIKIGVFLDSKVDGLFYKTNTQSGLTNNGGEYKYLDGEIVEFYIGDSQDGLKIGSSSVKNILTPIDLSENDSYAVEIIRLLLSVSTITDEVMNISDKTRELFQKSSFSKNNFLDIIKKDGFNNSTTLANFIIDNNISTKIYSTEEAVKHFNDNILSLSPKIGVLLDLQNSTLNGVNDVLIPTIKKDIEVYLETEGKLFSEINLIVKDTKNDSKVALQQLKELKESGVEIVIGPYSSSIAREILSYANENNIILLSPSSTSTSLAIEDDNLYRTVVNDFEQAKALVSLIKNNSDIKHILPIYRDDIFGKDYHDAIKDALVTSPELELLSGIKSNDTNMLNNIKDILKNYNENSVAILLIEFKDESKELLTTLGNDDLLNKMKFFSYNTLINIDLDDNLKEIANKVQLSGVTYTTDDSEFFVYYQNIVSKLKENGLTNVDPFVVNIWDSIWLATFIYTENEQLVLNQKNYETIKEILSPIAAKTKGATGFMMFNKFGDKEESKFSYYKFIDNRWNDIGIYKSSSFISNTIKIDSNNITNSINKELSVGVILNNTQWNSYSKPLIELAKSRINRYYSDKNIDFKININLSENNSSADKFTTLEQLQQYHENGINTIITSVSSEALELLQDYANSYDMHIIDCASSSSEIAKEDTTYRLTPNDNGKIEALIYKLNKDNIGNVILIYRDDIYGLSADNSFKNKFNGNILKEVVFEKETYLDLELLTKQIDNIEYEDYAIIYIAFDDEGVNFSQLSDTLKNTKWYSLDKLISANENIINNKLDFTYISYSPTKGLGFLMPQSYDLYSEMNSDNLSIYDINAYDAVFLTAISYYDSLNLEQTLDESIVNRSRNMQGISTFLGTDINGDRATFNYAFYSLINQKWELKDNYSNASYAILND